MMSCQNPCSSAIWQGLLDLSEPMTRQKIPPLQPHGKTRTRKAAGNNHHKLRKNQMPDEFLGEGCLTSQVSPIKITAIGLPLWGSGRHDDGQGPGNARLFCKENAMRSVLQWSVLTAWVCGIAISLAAVCDAAPAHQPLIVVSVASFEKLDGDVRWFVRSAGPESAPRFESLLQAWKKIGGLPGLDQIRPSGAVVWLDGVQLHGYIFVPVADPKRLLAALGPQVFEVTEQPSGVLKLKVKERTFFVKAKDKRWTCIADCEEALAEVPDDPSTALTGVPGRHSMAVRFSINGVPERLREKFVQNLRARADADLAGGRPLGQSEAGWVGYQLGLNGSTSLFQAMATDLDDITVGWSLDRKAGKFFLEASAQARPGTAMADCFARFGLCKTAFSGLALPGAAFTGQWTAKGDTASMADMLSVIDKIRKGVRSDIEQQGMPGDEAAISKQVADGLIDVLREMIVDGRLDGAVSVKLAPGAALMLAAAHVADGRKLDKEYERVVEKLRTMDAAEADRLFRPDQQYKGFNLHTLEIPAPPDAQSREMIAKLLGEKLQVVLAIGGQGIYLAAGKGGLSAVKQAIDRSAENALQPAPSFRCTVALQSVAGFVRAAGGGGDQAEGGVIAKLLQAPPGRDCVTFTLQPQDRNFGMRLEAEQGVVRLIMLSLVGGM
jgi:hypothetical protein